MNEKPILFSGQMIRAILEGRKTQTRRIMNPQPPNWCERFGWTCFTPKGSISGRGNYEDKGPGEKFFKLKYGDAKDFLWVRESFYAFEQKVYSSEGTSSNRQCFYREDGGILVNGAKWKPSIHMPRWASRITLEITSLRVERLNDITESDAKAEGVTLKEPTTESDIAEIQISDCSPDIKELARLMGPGQFGYKAEFEFLWHEINGKRAPWNSNPWVWVIEFRMANESKREEKANEY